MLPKLEFFSVIFLIVIHSYRLKSITNSPTYWPLNCSWFVGQNLGQVKINKIYFEQFDQRTFSSKHCDNFLSEIQAKILEFISDFLSTRFNWTKTIFNYFSLIGCSFTDIFCHVMYNWIFETHTVYMWCALDDAHLAFFALLFECALCDVHTARHVVLVHNARHVVLVQMM